MGPLDVDRIRARLGDGDAPRTFHVLATTSSTNDDARTLADEGAPTGTVVLADAQSAGRGRLGRAWHSAPRLGLYLSVLFRPRRPAWEATRWTIAAGVAAGLACREVSGVDVRLKWPNDLLVRGRKVGGILTEARTTGTEIVDLVVGLGLNVNHLEADLPPELSGSATSLRLARSGEPVDRETIVGAYLARWDALEGALERGMWDHVARAWERLCPEARGRPVRVEPLDAPAVVGTTDGLDSGGALRIRLEDGRSLVVRDGDRVRAQEG